ncbi:hypothetical protein CFC21_052495 [Triticum aestivum]|uniref:Uncharacterized protein n=3 Tax=Triticum TaxID=4564 RepID=A0A9R0SB23_TRITD|nr:hypothetical protein CFC21_052495 [Triticum aestivum]VAH92001.1 unnamed protein product [Triticum turgidum subsp. durum]
MQLILNFLGLDTSWSSCALLFGWCRIPQLLPRGSSFEPDSFSSWSVAHMELIAERKRSSNSLGSEKIRSSSSLEKERYSNRGQQQRAESAGQGRQQRIRSRDEFDSIAIDND